MEKIYRQGDVLIIRVSDVPEKGEAIPKDNGRTVLEYGEVTGHAHAIESRHVSLYWVKGELDKLLHVEKPATLRHEEHAPIDLPVGDYIIRRQREYAPEELRYVAD